jgi:uncharacterized protein
MATPLMPHATATWLVDNSSMTFEQIATFCGLHILEVQAIADENTPTKLIGRDPIRAGELSQAELDKAQADPDYAMVMEKGPEQLYRTKGPRYTPVSRRQDKPDGIMWIVRNHPEITDNQISKLIGATKQTVTSIRDKTHWNMQNITPKDPVTLSLTTQRELDALVAAAAKKAGIVHVDTTFGADREAMLGQLRAERDATALAAQVASGEVERPVEITAENLFKR